MRYVKIDVSFYASIAVLPQLQDIPDCMRKIKKILMCSDERMSDVEVLQGIFMGSCLHSNLEKKISEQIICGEMMQI